MRGSQSQRNWSTRQDLHLRSLGPRPSMLLLHYALLAPAALRGRPGAWFLWRRSVSFPGTMPRWKMVLNLAGRIRQAINKTCKIGSGGGNYTHLMEFMRLHSVL